MLSKDSYFTVQYVLNTQLRVAVAGVGFRFAPFVAVLKKMADSSDRWTDVCMERRGKCFPHNDPYNMVL
jgi:hypothetical protein